MSSIWDFFNSVQGWKNPADKAMPYLDEIPDELKPLFQPFIDAGNKSMNQYSDLSSSLATPGGATNNYNALASGFTASPGYQYMVDQDTKARNQSAAASGMAGTPAAQAALANDINGMASQDFNNYMGSVTNMQKTGINGLQDSSHMGLTASDEYGQALLKMLMEQAGLAYAGQANKNEMNSQTANLLANIASAGGSAAYSRFNKPPVKK